MHHTLVHHQLTGRQLRRRYSLPLWIIKTPSLAVRCTLQLEFSHFFWEGSQKVTCFRFPHRLRTLFPSWLSPLFATLRSSPSTLSYASESPLCRLQYLITYQCRMWHSHNFQLSDFSPTKKRMQQVSNISIFVMYSMYFLAALFGYLTFKGEGSSP